MSWLLENFNKKKTVQEATENDEESSDDDGGVLFFKLITFCSTAMVKTTK